MWRLNKAFSFYLILFCSMFLIGTLGWSTSSSQAAPEAAIRYVIPGGLTSGTCNNWANACDLQYALGIATSGDEFWVKTGAYKPTTGSDRSATFQLETDVALYGGFAGTESIRTQRNWVTNVTTLSGDISTAGNNNDNSYHVVSTVGGTTNTAILDGFTVTGGNADGSSDPDDRGGGMYNYYGNPTVQNVIFSNNTASLAGGGMYNSHSNPILSIVTFSSNSVVNGNGGGMVNTDASAPTLTDVTFNDNTITTGNGGGMLNDNCSPTLLNVTFDNNSTTGGNGGALYNDLVSTPSLTNVTFSNNSAIMDSGQNGGNGGAIYNYSTNNYTMSNVTFSGNSAVGYDGLHPGYGGAIYTASGSVTARNSIFWGNTPDQAYNDSSTTTINNSVVQGGCPTGSTCPDIITSDPLLGSLGNYGGNVQTIPLLPGSSALDTFIDVSCPATDARGVTRPKATYCDAGAFESNQFTLAITGGNNQTTPVNTTFAQPLQVSVTAKNAVEPVDGGKVTYTPPGSGASASLATSPATVASGLASVVGTANGIRGSYTVDAGMAGGNTVSFNLRNTSVFFVKPGASGDCNSWATACEMQTALGSAGLGDQVWVAAGTYMPTSGSDKNATFTLANGVKVYGGFAGTESELSQRNWTINITTLSGNLTGGAHSLHVVTANSTALTTVLDGFTITGGQAPSGAGGGVYINNGSLTIANCDIVNNSANYGGGLFQEGSGRVDFIDCLIERNHSGNQGGGLFINDDAAFTNTRVLSNTSGADGGGLTVWTGDINLTGGIFANNSAGNNGGGVNANNSVTISGTQFISNTASQYGGGLLQWNVGSTVNVTNARFERNNAGSEGGGLWMRGNTTATNMVVINNVAYLGSGVMLKGSSSNFLHTTISDNTGGDGCGIVILNDGSVYSTLVLTNTILVSHTVGITATAGNTVSLNGVLWFGNGANTGGAGNVNVQNSTADSPAFTSDGYHLTSASMAINQGVNSGVTTDIDGDPRPIGSGYDLGADEYVVVVYLPVIIRN